MGQVQGGQSRRVPNTDEAVRRGSKSAAAVFEARGASGQLQARSLRSLGWSSRSWTRNSGSIRSSHATQGRRSDGSDGSDEVAAADLVQATADGAVPLVVQAATGLPAASADVPGQAPVIPADGATAAVQQDVQPRSSRQKKKEESSFPTRFSPRKIRGSSHKYADTYYY